MTRREAVQFAEKQLLQAGIAEARLDARYLFCHVTGLSQTQLMLDGEELLSEDMCRHYEELVEKRAEHIPLQHLTGEQEFMGMSFEVTPDVLVPRQDTECLVEEVLKYSEGKRVLDLCTGSGCIAVSIAKLGKPQVVHASDLSKAALAVAERNAGKLRAEIRFFEGDLYEAISEKYDIIVSNPPYIATAELAGLMQEVRLHEPVMALDGAEDGLLFYRRIIEAAHDYLMPDGMLFFEIGCNQAGAVSTLLLQNGFESVQVRKDYAGLDRVVSARWVKAIPL